MYRMSRMSDCLQRMEQSACGKNRIFWRRRIPEFRASLLKNLDINQKFTQKKQGMLLACILLIAGVIWNRVNVSIIGIKTYDPYPSFPEILIAAGLISMGLIAFKRLAKILRKEKYYNR